MTAKKVLMSGQYCGNCGAELYVETDAEQPGPDHPMGWTWMAYDGDEAVCDDCGAVHYVSGDEDGAWISLNEDITPPGGWL